MTDRTWITRQIAYLLIFIASVLFFAILKVTVSVIMPALLAIMLSFVLLPIVRGMHKIHIPWALGILIVTLLFIACVVSVGTLVVIGLSAIIEQIPKYEEKFLSIYQFLAARFDLPFDEAGSLYANLQSAFGAQINLASLARRAMYSLSTNIAQTVRNIMVVILMFAFLLAEMKITSEKLSEAFNDGHSKLNVPYMVKKIMRQVVRFLSIKFYISLATGILVYALSMIVGLDFAIVWGFLAFVLNFIPTFGSIVSVVGTSAFSALQFIELNKTLSEILVPIFVIFFGTTLINMILGNVLEPRIEGQNLGISPFVILVMLSFWGWMWGFVGMILAVPLTVIIKIVCENIPLLHPVAILIGNRPQETREEFSEYDGNAEKSSATKSKAMNGQSSQINN